MVINIFYVYEHWRPDRGECFYVGKGKAQRAHDMRQRNRYHKFVQKKLSRLGLCVEVRIVADCLAESEAFALERERIAFWRADGADLVNLSDGGEGPSGLKHTEDWKRANSERNKGRKHTEETKARIAEAHRGKQWGLGYKKTPEQVEKTAKALRGRKRSETTKLKCREAQQARMLDPARRAVLSEAASRQMASLEARARTAAATKAAMTVPEVRAKMLGRVVRDETREKLRAMTTTQMRDPKARAAISRAVMCVETGKVFFGATEAARQLGLSKNAISNVVTGRTRRAGGFTFVYADAATSEGHG